ncbi:MAG TPA: hypothetical protein VHM31_06295 [Polyangia bacterium]|nr:hypothetical protein [Polyangia bacterium]
MTRTTPIVQIETIHLPDGEHPLPSGGVAVTLNHRLVEIRAPREHGGAAAQTATHEEAEHLVRMPIDVALLRVDPAWYVHTAPHSRPPRDFRGFEHLSTIEKERLITDREFEGYDYSAYEWRWVRTGDGITWVCKPRQDQRERRS